MMWHPLQAPSLATQVASGLRDVLLAAGCTAIDASRTGAYVMEFLRWGKGGSFSISTEENVLELVVQVTEARPLPRYGEAPDMLAIDAPRTVSGADRVGLRMTCPNPVAPVDIQRLVHDPETRLGIVEDLAERLALRNEELRLLYEELEQANQGTLALNAALEEAVEARSRFLATMSHEIRTPLHGILGVVEVLLHTTKEDATRRHLEALRFTSQHLLALINDVLDMAKIEAGRMNLDLAPFSLRRCVEDCLAMVATAARSKGIELGYVWQPGLQEGFEGDAARVRQILLNLLGNAVKFTWTGGAWVEVRGVPDGYELAIRDTGIGISSERLPRLFDAFEQAEQSAHRRQGGTGLGLSISKYLVEAMGGDITVRSQPDRGTTFTCRIASRPAASIASFEPDGRLAGRKALLVARGPVAARTLAAMMDEMGFDVTVVKRAADATVPAGYSVAVVAAGPVGGGLADVAPMRRAAPELPLVALAAAGEEDVGYEVPGVVTLAAPVRFSALHEALLSACFGEVRTPRALPRTFDRAMAVRHPLRILVAEDNELNRLVAAEFLAGYGYRPDVAVNGAVAVKMAAANTYDLIFMDIGMPVLDGLDATRAIRAAPGPQPRIVGLTAHVLADYEKKCKQAGMDAVLPKPLPPQMIARELVATKTAPPDATHGPDFMAQARPIFIRQLEAFLANAPSSPDDELGSEAHKLVSSAERMGQGALASALRALERSPARESTLEAALEEARRSLTWARQAADTAPGLARRSA